MHAHTTEPPGSPAPDESAIRSLYGALLDCWNKRNAGDYAAWFVEDGSLIGFDGSAINGHTDIDSHLSAIFADHPTGRYVGKIRAVHLLAPDVAIVRAVAGLVPPGRADLNPATNSIQSVVAVQRDGTWRIALFQNTPAQFQGRPEEVERLTEELRQLL